MELDDRQVACQTPPSRLPPPPQLRERGGGQGGGAEEGSGMVAVSRRVRVFEVQFLWLLFH